MSWRLIATAVVALSVGCGSSEELRPTLQSVQGKLTINGRPAEGATLILQPAAQKNFDSRGTRPTANVAPDGTFKVTTYQDGDGAPVGDYAVGVLWFATTASSVDRLGGAYSMPDQTGIRLSIKAGGSQLEPIEIKGARLASQQSAKPGKDLDGLGQP